jgi:excisionase family DNA binding protein
MALAMEKEPVALPEPEREDAARAAESVRMYLSREASASGTLTLEAAEAPGEVRVTVPAAVLRVLVDILGQMASGKAVTIVPYQAELTTQEAAEILNVSRGYVVKLLESGEIPYRTVGPRRRIRFEDLMAFKRQDDARRRVVARELTQDAVELGLGYEEEGR